MSTLCDLSSTLPQIVGALLDRETKLQRGRFREETLTDIVTASLAAFAGRNLMIEYPDEPTTGGDLDLDFVNTNTGGLLQIRLQAKRLNASTRAGRNVDMRHRSYEELLHVVPSSSALQFRTLISACGARLPLYMF